MTVALILIICYFSSGFLFNFGLVVVVFNEDRVSNFDWPGAHYINQADLDLL